MLDECFFQVVKVVDITTLNNRQYCVICDPIGADGKPQLGGKKLVKVRPNERKGVSKDEEEKPWAISILVVD